MKSPSLNSSYALATLCLGLGVVELTSCSTVSSREFAKYESAERIAKTHIATFDDLDFNVFSNQQWDRLHESHAKDVVVHWPDGHQTKGIEKHIEDLKAMFVYAPDTRIKVHPVKFGTGDWTRVIGERDGTFPIPMPP